MTTDKIYKIYPSSSGFMRNGEYEVEYNSACLRYLPVAVEAARLPIDPKYGTLGLIHEDRHAAILGSLMLHRELPIRKSYTDKVMYSGRIDFITTDDEIHETKASMSSGFKSSVIKKGNPKLSHIAQVMSYMIHTGYEKAKLVTGFYDPEYKFKEGRDFHILVKNDKILIDNVEFKYTKSEQEEYLKAAVEVLEEGLPHLKRPTNYLEFMGPCKFCPLKTLCSMLDRKKLTRQEFKIESIDLINHLSEEKTKAFSGNTDK